MSDAGRAEAAALALCRYYDVLRPESDRGKVTPDECDYGQASEVLAAADAYDREHGWLRIDRKALALVLTGASLDGYMLHDGQQLEADLAVAVHEALEARARLAGHYCGGRDKA